MKCNAYLVTQITVMAFATKQEYLKKNFHFWLNYSISTRLRDDTKNVRVYRTIKQAALWLYIMRFTVTASSSTLTRSHLHKPVGRDSEGRETLTPVFRSLSPVPTRNGRFNLNSAVKRLTDSSTAPWLINERKTKRKKLHCRKVHASKASFREEQQKEKGKSSPNKTCGNCLSCSLSFPALISYGFIERFMVA